jgi:hypothetical protein
MSSQAGVRAGGEAERVAWARKNFDPTENYTDSCKLL